MLEKLVNSLKFIFFIISIIFPANIFLVANVVNQQRPTSLKFFLSGNLHSQNIWFSWIRCFKKTLANFIELHHALDLDFRYLQWTPLNANIRLTPKIVKVTENTLTCPTVLRDSFLLFYKLSNRLLVSLTQFSVKTGYVSSII